MLKYFFVPLYFLLGFIGGYLLGNGEFLSAISCLVMVFILFLIQRRQYKKDTEAIRREAE